MYLTATWVIYIWILVFESNNCQWPLIYWCKALQAWPGPFISMDVKPAGVCNAAHGAADAAAVVASLPG